MRDAALVDRRRAVLTCDSDLFGGTPAPSADRVYDARSGYGEQKAAQGSNRQPCRRNVKFQEARKKQNESAPKRISPVNLTVQTGLQHTLRSHNREFVQSGGAAVAHGIVLLTGDDVLPTWYVSRHPI